MNNNTNEKPFIGSNTLDAAKDIKGPIINGDDDPIFDTLTEYEKEIDEDIEAGKYRDVPESEMPDLTGSRTFEIAHSRRYDRSYQKITPVDAFIESIDYNRIKTIAKAKGLRFTEYVEMVLHQLANGYIKSIDTEKHFKKQA